MDLTQIPDSALWGGITFAGTMLAAVWRVSAQATSLKVDAANLREENKEIRIMIADLKIVPLLKMELESMKNSVARIQSDIRELREESAVGKGYRMKSRSIIEEE